MKIATYKPRTSIDSFFDTDFNLMPKFNSHILNPRVDVVETDKQYSVSVELPGMEKKDVTLSVENSHLTISGEKKSDHEDDTVTTWRRERVFGSFKRSFKLGEGVDQGKIEAKFSNGVLTITVPKAKESLKKEIEIKIN